MEKYVITYKDESGENQFVTVDQKKAADVRRKWDAHQNIYIGDVYLSWTRIESIRPEKKRLERLNNQPVYDQELEEVDEETRQKYLNEIRDNLSAKLSM